MNPLMLYIQQAGWISGFALLVAFVLTFWNGRNVCRLAAAFYSMGAIIGIGAGVYFRVFSTWIIYHLTDGPPASSAILTTALAIPIGTALYGLGAVVLLWPGISQEKALRLGKILHLIILPLLILPVIIAAFFSNQGETYSELGWLVYPLLWFRIRENYNGVFTVESAINPAGSRNLEPGP
jgi:hypothetical protein